MLFRSIVLNVSLDGHAPVQRTVPTGWSDYGVLEDIVLTPLDEPTSVTLGGVGVAAAGDAIQVVPGSKESDDDGQRQATLLVKPGTDATVVAADGAEAATGSPAELGAHIKAESERWGRVVQAAGIKGN